MCEVVKATAILHNLIIDYEKQNNIESDYITDREYIPEHPFEIIAPDSRAATCEAVKIVNLARLQNAGMHAQLQDDLMHHIWMASGNQNA